MRVRLVRSTLAALLLTAASVPLSAPVAQATAVKSAPAPAFDSEHYQRLLAAEPPAEDFAVSPEVAAAKEAIQARVREFVSTRDTAHSFASFADPTTDKVVLSTDAPREVVAELVGSYGDLVHHTEEPVLDSNTRKYDTEPFWGGAGVKYPQAAPCTTGYAVRNAALKEFMVTAGHCFFNGQGVWVENTAGFVVGNDAYVGVVSGKALPTHDMALIGGQDYDGHIYVGGVNSSLGLPVTAAADPAKDVWTYCHSGRTTGEKCGHGVVDLAAEVCNTSGCKKPVAAYKGGTLHDGGDSGGPFFSKFADNSVAIRGHVIARTAEYGYVEMWSRVKAKYGVSIVTAG